MTIIDPKSGRPVASNGPTGKKFEVIETMHDGAVSWSVTIPAGAPGMTPIEMAHVMSMCLQSVIQNIRVSVEQQKIKAAMQTLNK
jgi:hypothetical protein